MDINRDKELIATIPSISNISSLSTARNEIVPSISSISSLSLPTATIPQIPNIPSLANDSHTPNNNDSNINNSTFVYAKLFNRNIFTCILIIETYVFYTAKRYESAIQIDCEINTILSNYFILGSNW